MGIVSPAVGDAMVKQLKRTRRQSPSDLIVDLNVQITKLERELNSARAQVATLLDENDTLRQQMKHLRPIGTAGLVTIEGKLFFDGRRVVKQQEAADELRVDQSQISRWLKAGKLKAVAVPGRKKPMIDWDSPGSISRRKAGRPKKTT